MAEPNTLTHNTPPVTSYQRTAAWLKTCGKEAGNPEHLSTQIGCMLEEIAELTENLRVSQDGWQIVLTRLTTDLNSLADALKCDKIVAHFPQHRLVDVLDALCDTEVTLNGVAYLQGFDKDGADQEVLRSNDSKLDERGNAVILPGGKVGKSSRYTPPDLRSFVKVGV